MSVQLLGAEVGRLHPPQPPRSQSPCSCRQRMRQLDGITDSMEMGLGGLRELVTDREAWRAVVHRVLDSDTTE